MSDDYRLYVNAERTVLLRIWRTGEVEVATREDPGDTWGPPVRLEAVDFRGARWLCGPCLAHEPGARDTSSLTVGPGKDSRAESAQPPRYVPRSA